MQEIMRQNAQNHGNMQKFIGQNTPNYGKHAGNHGTKYIKSWEICRKSWDKIHKMIGNMEQIMRQKCIKSWEICRKAWDKIHNIIGNMEQNMRQNA